MAKTSINIQRCNIGESRVHNYRDEEYTKRIPKDKIYYRPDLTSQNEHYVSPLMEGKTLDEWFTFQQDFYQKKFGQKMQLKDRTRVNKRTGKTTVIAGASPIREGVLVIKEDTTMEQVQEFCRRVKDVFNIDALEIHIHRDEGFCKVPDDPTTWTPNLHAHIVFNWMDLETAKSFKLDDVAMSRMQDLAAVTLGMERGESKEITGKEHLNRNDFIVAKQKEEAQEAIKAKEKAQQEEQAAKEEAAKANAEVESSKEWMETKRVEELRKIFALQQQTSEERKYNDTLDQRIASKEKRLSDMDTSLNDKLNELNTAKQEYQNVQTQLQMSKDTLEAYDAKKDWQPKMLEFSGGLLRRTIPEFDKAVKDVDDFAHANGSGHQDFFRPEQAYNFKYIFSCFNPNEPDEWHQIAEWFIWLAKQIRPMQFFEESKVRNQITGVIKGYYDRIIAKFLSGGVSR